MVVNQGRAQWGQWPHYQLVWAHHHNGNRQVLLKQSHSIKAVRWLIRICVHFSESDYATDGEFA